MSCYISILCTCLLAQPLLQFLLQGPLGAVLSHPLSPPLPSYHPHQSLDSVCVCLCVWCVCVVRVRCVCVCMVRVCVVCVLGGGVLRCFQTPGAKTSRPPPTPHLSQTSLPEVQLRISWEASLAYLLLVLGVQVEGGVPSLAPCPFTSFP